MNRYSVVENRPDGTHVVVAEGTSIEVDRESSLLTLDDVSFPEQLVMIDSPVIEVAPGEPIKAEGGTVIVDDKYPAVGEYLLMHMREVGGVPTPVPFATASTIRESGPSLTLSKVKKKDPRVLEGIRVERFEEKDD